MSDPALRDLFRSLEAHEACVLCVLVEVEGSAPRHVGAKILVRASGETAGTIGGGALEAAVVEAALDVLRAGTPRLVSYDLRPDLGMQCGGRAKIYLEPFQAPPRLFIFGAGHIGLALCPLATRVGFEVTVVDDRPDLASAARFPDAVGLVHSLDPAAWGERSPGAGDFCVVATANHATDTELVAALVPRPLAYLGMIGSRTKRLALERELERRGVPEEKGRQVRTPMGLSIGAETPEEIAVSIAAELIRTHRCADAPAETPNKASKKE